MLHYEAKNYAQALLEISISEGGVKRELENSKQFIEILNEFPDLVRIFTSAFVSKNEKRKMLEENFKTYLSRHLYALLMILIRRSSLHMLIEILEDFILLANSYLGIVRGIVFSPLALSKEKIATLEEAVGRKFNKIVVLENRINKDLLAGLRVEVEDHVIELSFASLLEAAREQLLKGKGGERRWL